MKQVQVWLLLGASAFVLAAGLRALDGAGSKVIHLPATEVSDAFAKGRPVLETASYKVHASRRDGPGQAELHSHDTDIFHVLTGSATFVTGGKVQGGAHVGPEEIRGASIEGGETRTLQAGDVIVIPHGVPHWFKAVPAPVTYYTVKVRTGTVAP